MIAVVALLCFGIFLSQVSGSGSSGKRSTLESPDDEGPSGLLALVVLLDTSEHPIERVSEPPSEGGLDSEKTSLLVAPGSLTAADANALNDLASDGGRVVVAGDPGDEGLSRLLGTQAEIGGGAGSGTLVPLTPADETAGVTSIESPDSRVVSPAGSALPIAGAAGEPGVVATDVGEGRVVVVADASILENAQLLLAENARFALNLAGEDGRDVQLVEAVRTPPSSGLSALPGAWGWAAAGLVLAGLAFAWARGRRIGPVELASRPLPPPRRQYVDALAGALLRTRDPHAAIAPLREAARDRLARRAGLPHNASDSQLREAAVAAGLEPAEVEAVSGQVGEGAMLAAAGAIAKLSRSQTLTKEDG